VAGGKPVVEAAKRGAHGRPRARNMRAAAGGSSAAAASTGAAAREINETEGGVEGGRAGVRDALPFRAVGGGGSGSGGSYGGGQRIGGIYGGRSVGAV
jgi:hypothetical protein